MGERPEGYTEVTSPDREVLMYRIAQPPAVGASHHTSPLNNLLLAARDQRVTPSVDALDTGS